MERGPVNRFRSRDWFADPSRSDVTALYLERFMNYGLTPGELRSGRPIIGIAQTGSDLSPCNRIHLDLARRVRNGIRDAGGIAMEFPVHPIVENCRRPTGLCAVDRKRRDLGQLPRAGRVAGLAVTYSGYAIFAAISFFFVKAMVNETRSRTGGHGGLIARAHIFKGRS